jgi:hypothetical protein
VFTPEDIKLINEGKVDSRAKGSAGHPVETHPTFPLQRVYCLMCTKPYGFVTQESYKYIEANNVIVVCDDCVLGMGEPPLQEANIPTIPIGSK